MFDLFRRIAKSKPYERADWQSRLSEEVEFWQDWFNTKGASWPGDYHKRLRADTPLQAYLLPFLEDCRDDISILDVGAGPMTVLGKRWERGRVTITAVDALAEAYDAMLDKAGVQPPVRTIYCEAERLTDTFAADSFDLVYAQNSLDHSYSPMTALDQMLAVVRPGRFVVTRHHRNEAVNGRYGGLHQWNFDVRNDKFVIWNKQERIDVASAFEDKADVTGCFRDSLVVATLRKR
jgi:SAM-dependent methyltransferase